jgi:histidyl-tRNA synthetase
MAQPIAGSRLSPARFVAHAAEVASFYGFNSRNNLLPSAGQPLLAFYTDSAPARVPSLPVREVGEFRLEITGSSESMSEAFLIKTSLAILGEWSGEPAHVRINAPGDRDSRSRFERELSWHVRKQSDNLCAHCRQHAAKDPLALYACLQNECRTVALDGPHAINYLSERSRAHFKSLLEQLEGLGVSYELDDFLASPQREARTLFVIDLPGQDGTVLAAQGGRYEEAVVSGAKKDAPKARASIFFRKRSAEKEYSAPAPAKPRLYFVQLGDRARMRGLLVLDQLRHAHINVGQSFDAKALSPQLARAREMGVSYLLIMGEREALDGTVIVRHASDSAQTTVAVSMLPRYLKTLHA